MAKAKINGGDCLLARAMRERGCSLREIRDYLAPGASLMAVQRALKRFDESWKKVLDARAKHDYSGLNICEAVALCDLELGEQKK